MKTKQFVVEVTADPIQKMDCMGTDGSGFKVRWSLLDRAEHPAIVIGFLTPFASFFTIPNSVHVIFNNRTRIQCSRHQLNGQRKKLP
jgi:hypothetical protein